MITRKRKLVVIFAPVFAVFVGLAIWAVLIEPNRLVVHQETILLPNWPAGLNNLRVAVISDIHAGSPFIDTTKMQQIVERTNGADPDLILLAGDFVIRDWFTSHRMEPQAIAEVLGHFRARLGVYAVLGNHDWWYNGEAVRGALENAGIRVLEGEVAEIKRDGHPLWIVGLGDAWTHPSKIQETLQKVPAGQPIIALTHNPDLFAELPPSVNLTIAGHTHGGQVNLPLLGRLVVPSKYGDRYAAGHFEEGGRHLFVTTGIGTSILPVRFRVPPEIAVLSISLKWQP